MEKPTKKHHRAPSYDWYEIKDYIQHLSGKKLRDWAGSDDDEQKPYLDYWHFLCDFASVSNGCYFYVPNYHLKDLPGSRKWTHEVTKLIHQHFADDNGDVSCYVSW